MRLLQTGGFKRLHSVKGFKLISEQQLCLYTLWIQDRTHLWNRKCFISWQSAGPETRQYQTQQTACPGQPHITWQTESSPTSPSQENKIWVRKQNQVRGSIHWVNSEHLRSGPTSSELKTVRSESRTKIQDLQVPSPVQLSQCNVNSLRPSVFVLLSFSWKSFFPLK